MPESVLDELNDIVEGDEGAKPQASKPSAPSNGFKAITIESQEDFDNLVRKRIERERKKFEGYEDFKAKAEKLAELEAAQGSDIEKLTRRAEKAENEREALKAQIAKAQRLDLVRDIAGELGLPAKLVSRVAGDDEDAIRADIADLLEGLPTVEVKQPETPGGGAKPPVRGPKQKMTFVSPSSSDEGLPVNVDEIMKQIPRSGLR